MLIFHAEKNVAISRLAEFSANWTGGIRKRKKAFTAPQGR
jgi:hypothetical protein